MSKSGGGGGGDNGTETVQVVIDTLKAAGVKVVFGVPGAKIDSVFNALIDHPEINVVVCHHEQNAAFIAAAVGKLSGTPGVCIATSGPGTSNLVTGLVTATDEGSPVVAIVGSVKRAQSAHRTHQSLRGVELLAPVTKKAVAAVVEDQVAEILLDAFRTAASFPQGAAAVSLPIDIISPGVSKLSTIPAFPTSAFLPPKHGPAPDESLDKAAEMIRAAKFPVLFLGMRASSALVVAAVHALLKKHPLPVVETFQAAGAISHELAHLFYGRIGLFRNQPGDKLLTHADLVLTIGYDEVEYDANVWNPHNRFDVIHMDYHSANIGYNYVPRLELVGSLVRSLEELTARLDQPLARPQETDVGKAIFTEFHAWETSDRALARSSGTGAGGQGRVHPLHFIRLLQAMIEPSTVVSCDVGSVYIWMCRYFFSYVPKTFLVSNAQQTLGVALPWAIGASLTQGTSKKVVSISGDGGFLFSGQELATAVQQGCNITHFVWNDESYNMVEFQEVDKYGRSAGVRLGGVDFAKYAEAFGAKGLRVEKSSDLEDAMRAALSHEGVCVVDIAIDYADNHELMKHVVADTIA